MKTLRRLPGFCIFPFLAIALLILGNSLLAQEALPANDAKVIAPAENVPKGEWLPPGDWELEWSDEFEGEGEPMHWYPMLGYDRPAYDKADAKGLRWTGPTEDTAVMYSTRSGNHWLDGEGHLVMRIISNKAETNAHGPKVEAAYLLSGLPEKWESTEPNGVKWEPGDGIFVSPAEGDLYISARIRTDRLVGYSTWFAFWLFSETRAYLDDPEHGTEVDVVEIAKGAPEYMKKSFNVANHWGKKDASESRQFNSASTPPSTSFVDVTDADFHTYGILWTPTSMECFVDGKSYYTFTENIPSDPVDMMIMLTLEYKENAWDPHQGDGRTEGPFVSDSPEMREMSRVLVDSVRVFRKN